MHRIAPHRIHGQHYQAVVEQQRIAGPHVAGQFLVVQAYGMDVTGFRAGGIQHEGGPRLQPDAALGKLAHPDLRALQVGHDGHLAAGPACGFAHHGGTLDVVLGRAMAEIEPHHADFVQDHLLQQLDGVGSGAKRCHDLGGVAGSEARHGRVSV